MRRAGIESTSGPTAHTPVHRARSRALSDSRSAALRVESASGGGQSDLTSTGRTRLCRRSKALRTRHQPYERTLNPDGRAHRSMWRPCSPDGELGIGRHRPLRTPAENFGKTTSPLELTLGTFVIHTQTKPGSHGAVLGQYQGTSGAAPAAAGRLRRPRGPPYENPGVGKGIREQKVSLIGDVIMLSNQTGRACGTPCTSVCLPCAIYTLCSGTCARC